MLVTGQRDYLYLHDAESRYLRLALARSSREMVTQFVTLRFSLTSFPLRQTAFLSMSRYAARSLSALFARRTKLLDRDGQPATAAKHCSMKMGRWKWARAVSPLNRSCLSDGRLITWADSAPLQDLADGYLPIPTVRWEQEHFWFAVTAFAAGKVGESALYARYRLENLSTATRHIKLFLAVRPFSGQPALARLE